MHHTEIVLLISRVQRHASVILHLLYSSLSTPNFFHAYVGTYKHYHTHHLQRYVTSCKNMKLHVNWCNRGSFNYKVKSKKNLKRIYTHTHIHTLTHTHNTTPAYQTSLGTRRSETQATHTHTHTHTTQPLPTRQY